VTFVEAATVSDDVDFLVNVDPRAIRRASSQLGFSSAARVLVVVHATRAERSRCIFARLLLFPKSATMPNVENDELEIPELSAGWFERAVQPTAGVCVAVRSAPYSSPRKSRDASAMTRNSSKRSLRFSKLLTTCAPRAKAPRALLSVLGGLGHPRESWASRGRAPRRGIAS
jgi:hypothetical protein